MSERGEITDTMGCIFSAIILGIAIFGITQCAAKDVEYREATKQKQIELEMLKIEKGIVDD